MMKKVKGVLENAKQQRAKNPNIRKTVEAKQRQKEAFKNIIYNKLKHWQPSNSANMNKFFSVPKELFQRGELSLSALAVYPVLCANDDFRDVDWRQLSLENIKEMTSLSIPTIQKALEELTNTVYTHIIDKNNKVKKIILLQRKKHTEEKRTFWLYKPWFIHQDQLETYKGEQFFFYTYIIDSGLWSKLDSKEKALYLAMRSMAKFDFLEYCSVEDITYGDPSETETVYKDRKWEVCRQSLTNLCEIIGISSYNIRTVAKSLERYNLIIKIEEGYMVYLLPIECNE